jgi:hypothetical protein
MAVTGGSACLWRKACAVGHCKSDEWADSVSTDVCRLHRLQQPSLAAVC